MTIPIIKASKCLGLLPNSSAPCVVLQDIDGMQWAVRYMDRHFRAIAELLVGHLAIAIGIPRTPLAVVESRDVEVELRSCGIASAQIEYGVGGVYRPGVLPLELARNVVDDNLWFLESTFGKSLNLQLLWGYWLFADWTQIRDRKYNALCIDERGEMLFLDFDLALGFPRTVQRGGYLYDEHRCVHTPGFCENLPGCRKGVEHWYAKMDRMEESVFWQAGNLVNEYWGVDRQVLKDICRQLFDYRREVYERFINVHYPLCS